MVDVCWIEERGNGGEKEGGKVKEEIERHTEQNSKHPKSVTATSARSSTNLARKKSPTGRPCTPQCSASGFGVPVAKDVVIVVVATMVVEG